MGSFVLDGEAALYRETNVKLTYGETRFGGVTAVHRHLNWNTPKADIIAAVTDQEQNLRASTLAAKTRTTDLEKCNHCLYIIAAGDMPVAKIGKTFKPHTRCGELQSGSWADLRIHALFWGKFDVVTWLEGASLRKAKQLDARLRGEWLALEPDEAVEFVIKVAKSRDDARLTDSAGLMHNIGQGVSALGIRARDLRQNLRGSEVLEQF